MALNPNQTRMALSISVMLLKSPACRSMADEGMTKRLFALGVLFAAIGEVSAEIIDREIDGVQALTGREIERDYDQLRFSFPEDEHAISARGPVLSMAFGGTEMKAFSPLIVDELLPRTEAMIADSGSDDFAELAKAAAEGLRRSYAHPMNRPGWLGLTLPLLLRHYFPMLTIPDLAPAASELATKLLTQAGRMMPDADQASAGSLRA